MKLFERLRQTDRELDSSLDELLERATEMVRYSLDQGLAGVDSAVSVAGDKAADGEALTGLASFEQLLGASLKKMPSDLRTKIASKARTRLGATGKEREQRYGRVISSLGLDGRHSVFDKAADISSHQQIKGLKERVRGGVQKLIDKLDAEDSDHNEESKTSQRSPRKAEKSAKSAAATGAARGAKAKFSDRLLRPSLADFLDLAPQVEFRPVELELLLTNVECIQDFKHEAGYDEISLGVVAQDIYSLPPGDIYFDPQKIGEFKAGREKEKKKITLPKTIATIPVADGDWRNRVYTASVYLAETDWGGFNRRKLEDLHGMSSHEMRDILFVAYTTSIFSLLGISGGAKSGFDGLGLTRAIGVGISPAVYSLVYGAVLGGFAGLGTVLLGLLGMKLIALSTKLVAEIIGDAVRDEFFPPQVISFHLDLPDGAVDTQGAGQPAIDFGTSFPIEPVRFEYIQTGKHIDEHKVIYDLTFEWKVRTELAKKVPETPPPVEDAPNSQEALDNLQKIDHIGVIMLENRSFDQMLSFLANDREESRLLNGKTTGMFNVLKARTDFQFDQIKGGKFDTTDPEVYDELKAFFTQDQIFPVLPLQSTQIEDDPGHNIVNVERQLHNRRDEFGRSLLISSDNPDSEAVPSDGFAIDPHWPSRLDVELPLCSTDLGAPSGDPNDRCAMVGFIEDYFQALVFRKRLHLQTLPTAGKISEEDWRKQREQLEQVMGYHPAAHVPAYDLFASEFGICDRRYSSYPGNTWVNRTISLCGKPGKRQKLTANDFRSKEEFKEWEEQQFHQEHGLFITNNDMPWDEESFFRYMDKTKKPDGSKVDWAFYAQDMPSLLCVDSSYASGFRNLMNGVPNRIKSIKKFFKDAEDGKLPEVFWIDPNFVDLGDIRETLGNREKNPVVEHWVEGERGKRDREREKDAFGEMILDVNTANDDHPPADISHGQHFALEVFNALLKSPNWHSTMLIIVYDEHGGFFDHVRPPYLDQLQNPVEPESPAFRSLGARVPAIVISPWIGRGLVSHTSFEHSSIIKTIMLRFLGTDTGISERVLKAHHLGGLLSEKSPRFSTVYSSGVGSSAERYRASGSENRDERSARSLASRPAGKEPALPVGGKSPRPRNEEDQEKRLARLKSAVQGTAAALRLYQGRDRMLRKGKRRPLTDLGEQMTSARKQVFERLFGKDG